MGGVDGKARWYKCRDLTLSTCVQDFAVMIQEEIAERKESAESENYYNLLMNELCHLHLYE